jgi:DNA-binding IclR family transcriptional regulator
VTEELEDDRFGIQSVEVAGSILGALTAAGHAMPLRDIVRATGLQGGKVHRYLVSLSRIGLVSQERESGHYSIGMGAIRLGLAGLRSVSAVKVCGDLLARLRDETEETALLSLWTPQGPVVVELEESSRPVFMNIRVGSILPLAQTATGRQFAAHLDDKDVTRLLDQERSAAQVPSDWSKIMTEVRKGGVAIVSGNLVPSVAAAAGGVFDHRGKIAAVLGIVGGVDDLRGARLTRAVSAVLKAAKDASDRLGNAPR